MALWTGLGPNIARNAIINAAELASYDQVKQVCVILSNFSQKNCWLYLIVHDSTLQTILSIPGFTDGMFTHLLAGLGAGFFAVLIGSPVDVVMFLVFYQIYIFMSRTYHNSKIPIFILKLLQINYYLLEN